jgi:hypothetical protein
MFERHRRRKASRRLREPTDDFLLKTLGPFVLLVFASGPLGGWGDVPIALILAAWLVLAGCGVALVRSWRVGVYVAKEGIEIVNLRNSRWLRWTELRSLSIGFPEARFWKWSPCATLADDSRIPMIGIQAPQPWTRPKNDFDERAVAQLETLLDTAIERSGKLEDSDLEFDRIK